MANIASNGSTLFKSTCVIDKVSVSFGPAIITTDAAPGPLLGDVIECIPGTQTIGVVARVGSGVNADKAYACTLNPKTPWTLLGPSARLQSIAYYDGRFVCARIGRFADGGPLILQTIAGAEISNTNAGDTNEGILCFDYIDKKFIIANTKPNSVGNYTLFKVIRRLTASNKVFYTGQKVGTPDILFTTNGSDIGFQSGPQPPYPQFCVVGETLIVNGGVSFAPPYPGQVPIPPTPVNKDRAELIYIRDHINSFLASNPQ